MPHYPCRQCEALYDPVTNVACPSCGEKHPLNCSKCDKQINHHDIFSIEKLKTFFSNRIQYDDAWHVSLVSTRTQGENRAANRMRNGR